MTNQENTELETTDVSYWADQLDALERLEKNPDFIKIIQNGYMKDKALDSVGMLGHPEVKRQGTRGDVMEDLVAISNLGYYLFMIKRLGEGARADLMDEEGPQTEE